MFRRVVQSLGEKDPCLAGITSLELDKSQTVERVDAKLRRVDAGSAGGELAGKCGACLLKIAVSQPDQPEQPVEATGGKTMVGARALILKGNAGAQERF